MKSEVISLHEGREDVTLTTYVLDDSQEITKGRYRPAVLICPGGAYLNCSDREAEPVALKFATMGYHAFVLCYSVYQEGKGGIPDWSKPMEPKPQCIHPNPMYDIAKAMLYIGAHAKDWLVDMSKVALCGFSAGAHNCAMYSVYWDKPVITEFFKEDAEKFRPAAVILGYPLTDYCYMKETMGNDPMANGLFAMSNSAFLGTPTPDDEHLKEISPVYHVSKSTPPAFIWSTASDELVPIQHSIRMAHALADKKIPFELHIYEEGGHGLSLGNQTTAEAQTQINADIWDWIEKAEKWLQKRFAYDLPEMTEMEQMLMSFEAMKREHVRMNSDDFYRVEELMPNIYRITSEEAVYMELFVGEKAALLFDTGYGYGDIKKVVRKITDKPLYIVNSHGHLDHACGNFQFEEDIYIHPKDMELCRQHCSSMKRQEALETAKNTLDYLTNETYNILPLDFDEETYVNAGCGNLVPMEEGKIFELGGMTLEVIELPGHTAGCIGLYYREKKMLYVGDSINAFLWLFMLEALTLSEYKQTLQKAMMIDFEKMVQAHNDRIEPKETMTYYIEAAEQVDFEKGTPFTSPLAPGVEARVCMRADKQMMNFKDADFAAVVISEEHLR